MKRIVFDPSKCNLCGACMAACSVVKKGRIDLPQSRVRIETAGSRKPLRAAVCAHCEEPACVTACMRGIIDKDETSGLVTRRWEDCFRCAACLVSCPVGAVLEDEDMKAFISCDLCGKTGGEDPLCVRVCLGGALCFEEEKDASENLRGNYAVKMFAEKSAAPAELTDDQWEEIARLIYEESGHNVTVRELKEIQGRGC